MRPRNFLGRRAGLLTGAVLALAAMTTGTAGAASKRADDRLSRVGHVVVIYEENHSFDNLYGTWEGVNGLAQADDAHTRQVAQNGSPYHCLLQNDVNLKAASPDDQCQDVNPTTGAAFSSHFFNEPRTSGDGNPFPIDAYIPPSATTCPAPGAGVGSGTPNGTGLPGGCTRDLVHEYYQEQYQLDGGRQDRYTTGSNAVGLTQGYYDSRALPIYQYLHGEDHPHYAISDAFFQAAFGGSFLNHQWLIAARTPFVCIPKPSDPDDCSQPPHDGSANDLHSVTDQNGMPNNYALYKATGPVKDSLLTEYCDSKAEQHDHPLRNPAHGNSVCGDWAVNTMQPPYQPFAPGTAASRRLPAQDSPTIGDRLSDAGRSWAWYSGGWSNADGRVGEPGWTNGTGPVVRGTNTKGCPDPAANAAATWPNCPDKLFQFHHQPFNYFANYAPGTEAREEHLRDEQELLDAANSSADECQLRDVSFVKPSGEENEHPGYASEADGSEHLVSLLKAIEDSACRKDTMVVVTYDEFGGEWDHVPPPGQGDVDGPHDAWGPGTRIPALTIAPGLRGDFEVDHEQHDTTSILATIENRFGLDPVGSRDAAVSDLSSVFAAHAPKDGEDEGVDEPELEPTTDAQP